MVNSGECGGVADGDVIDIEYWVDFDADDVVSGVGEDDAGVVSGGVDGSG